MPKIVSSLVLFLSLLVTVEPVYGALDCPDNCYRDSASGWITDCLVCGKNYDDSCKSCWHSSTWCHCPDGDQDEIVCPPTTHGCNRTSDGYCCPNGSGSDPGDGDDCTPSCPSSVCGTINDGCGDPCPCRECDTCSPQCGQASDCGTCGATDAGAPEAPTLVVPDGTITNPSGYSLTGTNSVIDLLWSSNSDLTDYYQVYVKDSNEVTVWNGAVGTTGVGSSGYTPGLYHWYVEAVNSTCTIDVGQTSANGYFTVSNSLLTLKNADGIVVPPESGNRNNICQPVFVDSSNDRRIIFEASVNSPGGWAEISGATLSWHGNDYAMSKLTGSGIGGTLVTTVDFGAASNNSGVFPLSVSVSNSYGTNVNNVFGDLKVWDCQVPVSGTLYDGTGGQACNELGFMTPVDANLDFSSLVFKDVSGDSDVSMSTSLPANYGPTKITYGRTYLPIFNGGDMANPDGTILGTGRMTRLIDLGTGATLCPSESQFNLQNNVSAYEVDPGAQVDFSFIKDQEAWFQVSGAGVKAKSGIDSGVPITVDSALRALSISGMNADNGLVSFVNYRNINGFNDNSGFGLPNNWWIDRNTNDSNSYGYQYFYNNFLINNGVGVTGTDWSGKPSEGVYFVNGNLNIDSDFALDSGKTMIVVVRGKISIAESVSRIDGIYIANNGIEALGSSANQLVINGMLYSKGNIRLARSFEDKMQNNTTPAVKINYQPGLIFNLPGKLMRVLSDWQEE